MFNRLSFFVFVVLFVLNTQPVLADPATSINDGKGQVVAQETVNSVYTNKLTTVLPSKENSAKRLAHITKLKQVGLSPEGLMQVKQDMAVFDKELITVWAHSIKFADGRIFARKIEPILINDEHLVNLFPKIYFYSLQLPGYFGGAAPSEMILRNFEVPAPLQRSNIIAVNNDATIWLMTDQASRQQFFQSFSPLVKSDAAARTCAAGWLRLSQEFVWQFNENPPFNIVEKDFIVKELHDNNMKMEVTGKAVVDPKSNTKGDITAILLFTNEGKMKSVTETQNIDFGLVPLPPSAAPGGPGGRPMPE